MLLNIHGKSSIGLGNSSGTRFSRLRFIFGSSRVLICGLLVATFCFVKNDVIVTKTVKSNPRLSVYLGGNECRWEPPDYEPPALNITFHKTLIAGFPSGDKRLVFIQMEGLTGLSAKDEWNFEFEGYSNHPFIKSNYPHHEGIWSWGGEIDQVLMVVRNVRRTLVEYHDILWDIDYAKTFEIAFANSDKLYQERPPLDDFLTWRDERVIQEISWYGWYIDYWMEGGLMRDIFTHKMTTPEHWNLIRHNTHNKNRHDLKYDDFVGDESNVQPTKDPHCIDDLSDCFPMGVISGEKLVEPGTGPVESRKIASALKGKTGVTDYLIEDEAWECIWEELIVRKKGVKTFLDREGLNERSYNFSGDMILLMVGELDRLIEKYDVWSEKIAEDLVTLLREHRQQLDFELKEVQAGRILLNKSDVLGPEARKRMDAATK